MLPEPESVSILFQLAYKIRSRGRMRAQLYGQPLKERYLAAAVYKHSVVHLTPDTLNQGDKAILGFWKRTFHHRLLLYTHTMSVLAMASALLNKLQA